ncbi:MAG: endonuclease III [Thermoplasmataceae archaeon]|jgi:endonuclease-3
MNEKKARSIIRTLFENIRSQSPPHHFEFQDPFWVLITTILSHRTKDEVTDAAARALFKRYGTMENLSEASEKDVQELISKVGFRTVKAKRVIEASSIIRNNFGGNVPRRIEDLMTIPGVGRKTANVVLADSMGIPAIAVDTHVQRISYRIGLSSSTDPEKTEMILRKIVPKDLWLDFNTTLVEFGKKICRPVGPKCDICKVSIYCEYFNSNKSRKKSSRMKDHI